MMPSPASALAVGLWVLALLLLCLVGAAAWMIHMPGRSFAGAPAPLDQAQQITRARLRAHVAFIASEEHNVWRPERGWKVLAPLQCPRCGADMIAFEPSGYT